MKNEKRIHDVNDQAALNNNVDAATLQMNDTIRKQHKQPSTVNKQPRKTNGKNSL